MKRPALIILSMLLIFAGLAIAYAACAAPKSADLPSFMSDIARAQLDRDLARIQQARAAADAAAANIMAATKEYEDDAKKLLTEHKISLEDFNSGTVKVDLKTGKITRPAPPSAAPDMDAKPPKK